MPEIVKGHVVPSFGTVPTRAIVGLTPAQLRVFSMLCAYANRVGESWPRTSTLADVLGLTANRVRAILRELAEAGWIEGAERDKDDKAWLLPSVVCARRTVGEQPSRLVSNRDAVGEQPPEANTPLLGTNNVTKGSEQSSDGADKQPPRRRKVVDVPDSPYAIGPRSPASWPPSPDDDVGKLLAFHVDGVPLRNVWREKYPELDGCNQRPSLVQALEQAIETLTVRPPAKRALTPRRFEAWLQPMAQRYHASWKRDTGGNVDVEAMADAGRKVRLL